MRTADLSTFYIDFSDNILMTDDEKIAIERIQQEFRPIERTELLLEYLAEKKITDDQFEKMTGLPYLFTQRTLIGEGLNPSPIYIHFMMSINILRVLSLREASVRG